MGDSLALLVGTRKGAWIVRANEDRDRWELKGPLQLGCNVHHMVLDPRDGKTLLMATRTGHLGPTVLRSEDLGDTWTEAEAPPAFPKAAEGEEGRVVNHVFWLTPGHASQPGVWYAGTSPQALFRSDDGGKTWAGVSGLNDHPDLMAWTGGDGGGTPDGPKLHSILVDPRDAAHLYVNMSSGGTFESLDAGATWTPLDARFPGLRFRIVDEQDQIRPHINVFVGDAVAKSLDHPVGDATVQIVGALSGG